MPALVCRCDCVVGCICPATKNSGNYCGADHGVDRKPAGNVEPAGGGAMQQMMTEHDRVMSGIKEADSVYGSWIW
ncbi:MAG: hypothetical protein ACLQDI_07555 [Syntrophobacteraceae bacterium]